MKRAGRNDSRAVVIIGEKEWQQGAVTVRDLRTGEQTEVPANQVVAQVTQILQDQPAAD